MGESRRKKKSITLGKCYEIPGMRLTHILNLKISINTRELTARRDLA